MLIIVLIRPVTQFQAECNHQSGSIKHGLITTVIYSQKSPTRFTDILALIVQ